MSMSQYHCIVCGLPVKIDGIVSRRLAVVWLKGKGTIVDSIEDELYQYRHEFCKPVDVEFIQPALF